MKRKHNKREELLKDMVMKDVKGAKDHLVKKEKGKEDPALNLKKTLMLVRCYFDLK